MGALSTSTVTGLVTLGTGLGTLVAGGVSLLGALAVTARPAGTSRASAAAMPTPAAAVRRRWIVRARVRTSASESGAASRLSAPTVQRLVQQVLGRSRVHRSSSRAVRDWGARARSPARARLAWDFTVPTEMPRTSAISASLSCS